MSSKTECVHHWVLGENRPRERTPGVCKKCGAERTFSHTPPDSFSWSEPVSERRRVEVARDADADRYVLAEERN